MFTNNKCKYVILFAFSIRLMSACLPASRKYAQIGAQQQHDEENNFSSLTRR